MFRVLLLTLLLLSACSTQPALPEGVTGINPPQTMMDFELVNQHGEPFQLHQLQGKYVLIAFGYTHCPDVCPITLAQMRRVQEGLGAQKDSVEFVFISVDGQRDTPEILNEHLTKFGVNFVGLTGTDEDYMHEILRQYGGDFLINDGGGYRTENYSVDHTASKFLLDDQGRWVRTYGYNLDPNVIAKDINSLLQQGA